MQETSQPQWTFFPALNYDKIEPYGTTYGLMNSWRDHNGFRPMSRSYNVGQSLPALPPSRSFSRSEHMFQGPKHDFALHRSQTMGAGEMQQSFSRFQNKGMNPTFPLFGTPRMRYGRAGGSWRHVKEVVQARGANTIFVDGNPKMDDNNRLVYKDAEYGNVIQPSATCKVPIGVGARTPPATRVKSPVYNTKYAVGSMKGLERNNWMIVR